jgi:hypothetical protein
MATKMPETSTEQKQTDQKITIVQNPAFTVEFFDKQKTTWNRWVYPIKNMEREIRSKKAKNSFV